MIEFLVRPAASLFFRSLSSLARSKERQLLKSNGRDYDDRMRDLGFTVYVGAAHPSELPLNERQPLARRAFVMRNIYSGFAATCIVSIALASTQYALTIATIQGLFLASLIIPLTCTILHEKSVFFKEIDACCGTLANIASLIASIGAVYLGSLPLIGMGGVLIAHNFIVLYFDDIKPTDSRRTNTAH